MKRVFADTNALRMNQDEGADVAPIIIHDSETGVTERTTAVRIVGPAEMRYEMTPEHNLARVWVECEADALEFDPVESGDPYRTS